MSTQKSSRFTVELETGADPIRGSIEQLDGSRQSFWGWLELIEALRRAAADPSAAWQKPQTPEKESS